MTHNRHASRITLHVIYVTLGSCIFFRLDSGINLIDFRLHHFFKFSQNRFHSLAADAVTILYFGERLRRWSNRSWANVRRIKLKS